MSNIWNKRNIRGGAIMAKMLVTQALDERDLLVKKINDKILKANFIDAAKHNEDKVIMSKETRNAFVEDAKSAYQQILDLIKRYQKVDAAIVASNASTYVETSYGKLTVAGALSLRARLMDNSAYGDDAAFENILMEKMEDQYESSIKTVDDRNEQLANTAEQMRLSILGKDTNKNKEEKPLAVVDEYVTENKTELVDPIDIRKKIADLKGRKDTLLTELNTQIKVANATTVVEI